MSNAQALMQYQGTPITKETVKTYICPNATDQELTMFLELCKKRDLNPFLKQAYLIKYGTSPATMVVSKDVFIERANKIDVYRGFKAGVILLSTNGEIVKTEGLVYPGHKIAGGWATVYRSDREPLTVEVNISEYEGRKKDGEVNGQWASKPATMIRKVAIVHAHREAFPDEFQGMYDEAEGASMRRADVRDSEPMPQPKKLEQKPESSQDTPPPFCVTCGVEITPDVYKWSVEKNGKPLCRTHQKTGAEASL